MSGILGCCGPWLALDDDVVLAGTRCVSKARLWGCQNLGAINRASVSLASSKAMTSVNEEKANNCLVAQLTIGSPALKF